jgi:hypothetical protein
MRESSMEFSLVGGAEQIVYKVTGTYMHTQTQLNTLVTRTHTHTHNRARYRAEQ